MESLVTYILAGGRGERLRPLTARRAKPVVPFAGRRLIDFTLESCARSGLRRVTVLTEHRAATVGRHVRAHWGDLARVLPSRACGRRFRGTADAVRAALAREPEGDRVLVLAGDHVYAADYRWLLATHLMADAELTLSAIRVTPAEARGLGLLEFGADGLVSAFREKPRDPPAAPLASMGIYLFERRALEDALRAHPDAMDFGHDLLPRLIAGGWRVAARPFTGPWRDIADVDAYFEAHLPYRGHGSNYIWPHASIAPDAQVEESIVLNGAEIGEGACLRRVVVEEGVRVPAGARVVAERVTVLTAAVADDLTAPRRQRPSGATRRT